MSPEKMGYLKSTLLVGSKSIVTATKEFGRQVLFFLFFFLNPPKALLTFV